MKILLVSGPGISLKEPYNSGIEAFIVSHANQLVSEGHMVHVVAEEAENDSLFTIINPFNSRSIFFLKRYREQRQFKNLAIDQYDVIHYNMFYPHLLKAGLHFNKPSFITLHSPADNKRISVYKKLSRHKNVTFVAISERIKQQWDYALGIGTRLISNGINTHLWREVSSKNPTYLLWSARINEEKNVSAAIKLAKHMRLPLKIAGRIADQNYFDIKVKPHLDSQIQYVGHVTQQQLKSLAQNASAYLATATWQEPFGLAALEMLASGVPVVGFHTAVPSEWQHESVLTTESHSWQDLIELVEKSNAVYPDTCKEFASAMTIQNMTSNYLELYKERSSSREDRCEEAILADDSFLEAACQNPLIAS